MWILNILDRILARLDQWALDRWIPDRQSRIEKLKHPSVK
jgi:hypothetical protein